MFQSINFHSLKLGCRESDDGMLGSMVCWARLGAKLADDDDFKQISHTQYIRTRTFYIHDTVKDL